MTTNIAKTEAAKVLKADLATAHNGPMTAAATDRVLSATLDNIVTSENVSEGRIATLAHAIVSGVIAAEAIGANMAFGGTVTVKGTKGSKNKPARPDATVEVEITREVLHKVARGTADADTMSNLKAALASHSPAATAARALMASFVGMSAADRFLRDGEIGRARKVAQAASQALVRPLRVASIVLTDPDYIAESARINKNGVLEVALSAKPATFVKLGDKTVGAAIKRLSANSKAVTNAKAADTRDPHDAMTPLARAIREARSTAQKGFALDIIKSASEIATTIAASENKPENRPTGELREEMLALWSALVACFTDEDRVAYETEMSASDDDDDAPTLTDDSNVHAAGTIAA